MVRGRRTGPPVEVVRRPELGPCHEWQGPTDKDGYGKLFRDGKYQRFHRWAYEQAHGPLPEHMMVCHRCDNPPCGNPDHLFAGTIQVNSADMVTKGRSLRGERNVKNKIPAVEIPKIRDLLKKGAAVADLAVRYGVQPPAIRKIQTGQNWSWL